MPHFMLLLHESTTRRPDLGPAEIQAIIARYVAWADAMRARGRLVAGDKLEEGGRVLRREAGKVVAKDGPYGEAKELVGGYFVLEARDHVEAVELASGCPHLELGGTIELRAVQEVHG